MMTRKQLFNENGYGFAILNRDNNSKRKLGNFNKIGYTDIMIAIIDNFSSDFTQSVAYK
jgi:hypothetical protein